MTDFIVHPAKAGLQGAVPVASDKSIVHRAIIFGALGKGRSRITGARIGDDHRSTIGAFRAMGVAIEIEEGKSSQSITIDGVGLEGLKEPSAPLDCGNSGTTMRLLSGLLAAMRFRTVLMGDPSLSGRPMARVANPLRSRGARIEGKLNPKKVGEITAPLEIGPLPAPHLLSRLAYDSPIASAQVKGALLLSGLYSDGSTIVSEPVISRDHTERMLSSLGVPIARMGAVVELDGARFSGQLPGFDVVAPGDPSAAAFLIAAASIVAGSQVEVRNVGVNPTRMGFTDLAKMMGAEIKVEPHGETIGEPFGDVTAWSARTRGMSVSGEAIARTIDEVPILSVLAARSNGVTTISDASELRVKESDRIASTVGLLRAFGFEAEERPDGLSIEGAPDRRARATTIDSGGDHRIAMSAAIMALVGDGPTRVTHVDCIGTSFPRFAGTLRALGATIEVVPSE